MFSARHISLVLTFFGLLTAMSQGTALAQTPEPQTSSRRLELTADLVLSKEFCSTKFKKGSWATIKESFDVGPMACEEIELTLAEIFSKMTRVDAPPAQPDAQIVVTPRFVDVAATTGVTAFSNRDLVVVLEWTVKDASGKTIWIETVEGSATNHMGNVFTYHKNRRRIVNESVRDAAEQAAQKMLASTELQKLTR